MSDIKLFLINDARVSELEPSSVVLEKSLQTFIEGHLEVLLGIRFLETEHSTGKTHAGRIDTLGIDENGCPCIIEYKRSSNQNVINQGLFYLDWLLDHRGEFELLVLKKLPEMAQSIEWTRPRLLCIAGDFTKYDQHAVQQIDRDIDLLRYVKFGANLFLLEWVYAAQAAADSDHGPLPVSTIKTKYKDKTVSEHLEQAGPELIDLYEGLKAALLALGDDVQMKILKLYIAFKRIKNFASVDVHSGQNKILVYVKVAPDSVALADGFTRDVREIGHWGTGDLEITLRNRADIERAMPLLRKSYEMC